MKTCPQKHRHVVPIFVHRAPSRIGLLAALLLAITLPAAASTPADEKGYTIFVGTNLAIRDATGRSPVVGVKDNSLVVRQKGATRTVALDGIQGLQFERGVKLSSLSAEIADVDISFSSQAASRAWFQAASVQMALQRNAALERDAAMGAVTRASTATIPVGSDPFGQKDAARDLAARELARAESELGRGIDNAAVTESMADMHGEKTLDEARRVDADTVRVSFKLASPRPLGRGYVVLITEYQIGGKEGTIEHGISAGEFDRLDASPRKFRMQQNSLPGQWALKGYRIVVYADGQEVATNLSERRIAVDRDGAHKFFVVQYLAANKGRTCPPSSIAMVPKEELRAAARHAELPTEVFVKVDKTGSVLSISTDRFGNTKASPACEVFLENLRFLPALENGEPIEGSSKLVIADVIR